jgi:hypothetical protein
MRYLKRYKKFFEDGDGGGSLAGGDSGGVAYANASTPGMGAVVSAQPGLLPGTTGTDGSGDVSMTLKKKKRKKGKPSEVSDLRDLDKADTVNIKESNNLDKEENNIIQDCIAELLDDGFLSDINSKKTKNQVDLDSDHVSYFIDERLSINLSKDILDKHDEINKPGLRVHSKFNKDGITKTTFIPEYLGLKTDESDVAYFDIVEDVSSKLINLLGYESGSFAISFKLNSLDISILLNKTILSDKVS